MAVLEEELGQIVGVLWADEGGQDVPPGNNPTSAPGREDPMHLPETPSSALPERLDSPRPHFNRMRGSRNV